MENRNQGLQLGDSSNTAARRPRGRPPGSKNKPKALLDITRENEKLLRAHILEISAGCDVFEALMGYARRRHRAFSVHSGIGIVSAATLRESSSVTGFFTIQERLEILSMSGFFLPPLGAINLTVTFSTGKGQVIGGHVVGRLIALTPVTIFTAVFNNVSYERLPSPEDEEAFRARLVETAVQGGGASGVGVSQFTDQIMGLSSFNLPSNNQNDQNPVENSWMATSGDLPEY